MKHVLCCCQSATHGRCPKNACTKDCWFINTCAFLYLGAKGQFITWAGVGMSSATPVALTTLAAYKHANVCSGTMKPLSHPLQHEHDLAELHPRSRHGTHLIACQPPLRGTRSGACTAGTHPGVSRWGFQPGRLPLPVATPLLCRLVYHWHHEGPPPATVALAICFSD